MKYYKLLIILVLAVSIFGCSPEKEAEAIRPQTEPVLSPQDFRTQSTSWEVDKDISRLPQIVISVFKELGLALNQQDKKPGRYVFTGISPSGFEVTVEAIAILKDISFIRVSVGGKQEDIIIRKLLLQNISDALRTAIRKRN